MQLLVLLILVFSAQSTNYVEIFIESQCPDTIQLLKKMKPLLEHKQIFELVTFNFIPFGKGSEKLILNEGYQFTCQHAAIECYGNLIDSCVLELLDQVDQLDYLICIHEKRYNNEQLINYNLKKCVQNHECLYERTLKCASSKYGNYLQHKAAKITLAQHLTEIPWINYNGQHDKQFDKSFRSNPLKTLCETIDCQKYDINI